jgi:hypothetical protein
MNDEHEFEEELELNTEEDVQKLNTPILVRSNILSDCPKKERQEIADMFKSYCKLGWMIGEIPKPFIVGSQKWCQFLLVIIDKYEQQKKVEK